MININSLNNKHPFINKFFCFNFIKSKRMHALIKRLKVGSPRLLISYHYFENEFSDLFSI